jgi:hypothetical protein
LNYGFTSLFLAEAGIKLLGTGLTAYFSDNWNRFDFALAIGSVVGIISSMYSSGV